MPRKLCYLLMSMHMQSLGKHRGSWAQKLTTHLVHDGIPRCTPCQTEHLTLVGAELHAPARCAAAAAYAPCLCALVATNAVRTAAAAWRHQLRRGGRCQMSRRQTRVIMQQRRGRADRQVQGSEASLHILTAAPAAVASQWSTAPTPAWRTMAAARKARSVPLHSVQQSCSCSRQRQHQERTASGFAGVCSRMWLNDACLKGSSGCWDSQPLTACGHGSQSPALVAGPKRLPAQVAAARGAG
jgi:hypothetical protein